VVLKDFRERRGLSQQALAERVGVSDAYIAMLETGTRRNPSLPLLQRLAKALGVPVTALLE
jgi:transcriptional regulator with XRE-family HTH domain